MVESALEVMGMERRGFIVGLLTASFAAAAPPKEETVTLAISGMT